MRFQLDSEQKPTKIGLGMYSKEEEYVSFSEPCDCSGQVRGRTSSIRMVWGAALPHHIWASVELHYSPLMRERLEEVLV